MVSCQGSAYFVTTILTVCLSTSLTHCETTESENSSQKDDHLRMTHLSAISDLKHSTNAVKRHRLVLDLSKKIFNLVDESRRSIPADKAFAKLDSVSPHDASYQKVFTYLENTAFFCDLLVFFPEVLSKVLQENLLWRVTLIDSIQDAISFNAKFVDENTLTQFEKAYKILNEGTVPSEDTKINTKRKVKETKKPERKPRLTVNEL